MSLIPPVASSRCKCGRATSHLHYSNNHDYSLRFGLGCFLASEAVAFVKGWVVASTKLMFSTNEIDAYNRVTFASSLLTAPYKGFDVAVTVLEVLMFALALVALLTLHSQKLTEAHSISIIAVIGFFFAHWFLQTYYYYLTNAAIARLPEFVDASTLATANRMDKAFQAAYGFWGTAGPEIVIMIFSVAFVAFFIYAFWKRDVVATWTPGTVMTVMEPPTPTIPLQHPTSPTVGATTVPRTKFCRFCGARIVRDSKFCEECGGKLI